MVTGGTGFVGAHSVRALRQAGHEVTLLVRDPRRIGSNLGPLGVGVGGLDHVVGDMGDTAAVTRAMRGCDAVLHSAAMVTLERRRAAEMLAANPAGAKVVLDAAVDAGLDPIVYVSSTSALFAPGIGRLHADLPPTTATSAYGRSKAAAEDHARRHQVDGAPVTITYPAGVVGPSAGTAAGEMAGAIALQLRTGLLPVADGAVSHVDVRDLAAVHAAVMEPGRGPRRFMCGGHHLTMSQLAGIYRRLTGRAFPVLPLPAVSLRGFGRVMDAVMRVTPVDSVLTAEAMTLLTRWVETDDRAIVEELGVALRPPEETLADAILSLLADGAVTRRQAGRLADVT